MKKFGRWLLELGLWRPAAALMRNLRFPAKIGLVTLAFVLPALWLLALYVNAKWHDLDFVEQERRGVRYAAAIYPAIDAVMAWRYQARNAAFGEDASQLPQARARFDAEFARLEKLDAELGQRLASGTAFERVRAALKGAQAPQADADAVYKSMNEINRALVALLDRVTDGSELALDPELSSYYLMSASLQHGPPLIQGTSELRGIGRSAYKAGRLGADARALLHERLGVVAFEAQQIKVQLEKVRQGAPAQAAAVSSVGLEAVEKFQALVRATFPAGQAELSGSVDAYAAAAIQAGQAQFEQADKNLALLDAMLAERQRLLRNGIALMLSINLLGVLLAVYLFMGFYGAIAGGFRMLRQHLLRISMGDLRTEVKSGGRDEVAGLLKELNHMQQALSETVLRVREASETVVNSAAEIAQGTQDLSARTDAAAAALQQSSSALEQTTAAVNLTAESTKQASQIALDNAATATKGGAVMHEVVQTMERIQESSRKISDIIGVIDGIAFQTNILALNAAVEAARAGEQGKGFAVVASEVRSLAQRSANAAKEIKMLISDSTEEVSVGTEVVRKAGATMQTIVGNAEQIKQLLDEVANGAREQSAGIHQIDGAVQELDRNTQANAGLVQQTAEAAGAQRVAAVRMAAQVDEFRLAGRAETTLVEGIDVDAIVDAHRQWKVKLRDAIEQGAKVDVATLSCDDCCTLGKWIYGDGQHLAGRHRFESLREKHKHFHRVAGGIGESINRGHYEQAEDELAPGTEFARATSEVVLELASAKRLGFD